MVTPSQGSTRQQHAASHARHELCLLSRSTARLLMLPVFLLIPRLCAVDSCATNVAGYPMDFTDRHGAAGTGSQEPNAKPHDALDLGDGRARDADRGCGSSVCKCTTCSGSELEKMLLPHLGKCNLCGSPRLVSLLGVLVRVTPAVTCVSCND